MNSSMFENLFQLSVSPFNLIFRTFVVYFVILLLLRLAGRKQIAQMGPTELVAMLLISNAVQNSMNAGDNTLLGGLISALSLVVASRGVSYLTYRSPMLSDIIEGKPLLLVLDGRVQEPALRKLMMSPGQLRSALMLQGVERLTDLSRVVMDSEGHLVIMHKDPLKKFDPPLRLDADE